MPTSVEGLIDPLAKFTDGACAQDSGVPVPLVATAIEARVLGGLALVRTERAFRNAEERSIEATITIPVPVHATVVALSATIDGRVMTGTAKRKRQARDTYERAIDTGKAAVLHEEAIRGVHILSVGHVPPGKDIVVASTWVMPLSRQGDVSFVRIPVTVGQVYGRSPLPDVDDLVHGPVRHEASLTVSTTSGVAEVRGTQLVGGRARVLLDHPIDIVVRGWSPLTLYGTAADGRDLAVDLIPVPAADAALDLDLVVDQSGSMRAPADGRRASPSKHDVAVTGIKHALGGLRRDDRVQLWQFDNKCEPVGSVLGFWGPRGGTEIGHALAQVAHTSRATDIVVLTDGKSHAMDVQSLAGTGKRVTAILVGDDSLDAQIGYLAALTGGQLFVVQGVEAADAIAAALASLRQPHAIHPRIRGPLGAVGARLGGMEVTARWATGRLLRQ